MSAEAFARIGIWPIPPVRFVPDREQCIVELCAGKVVLHVGCGSPNVPELGANRGEAIHARLIERARRVFGVDTIENIQRMRSLHGYEDLHVADVEALDVQLPCVPDIIAAPEILDHIDNPGAFLAGARRLMGPSTSLVLMVPNVLSLKMALFNLFGYQRIFWDHRAGYTFRLLDAALGRVGLEVEQWFTSLERFGSPKNNLWNSLARPLYELSPRWGDTIILVARTRGGNGGN